MQKSDLSHFRVPLEEAYQLGDGDSRLLQVGDQTVEHLERENRVAVPSRLERLAFHDNQSSTWDPTLMSCHSRATPGGQTWSKTVAPGQGEMARDQELLAKPQVGAERIISFPS
jgi:hypothetical protein